jgi:hypothetical protein
MKLRTHKLRAYWTHGSTVGKRCKVYCQGCVTCETYRFLDMHGRFPHTFNEIIDQLVTEKI